MARALCLKCSVVEIEHTKHMWRICNKDALPIPGAKMNFDKCMATGGYKGLVSASPHVMQQGEGRNYRPPKQFS